MKKNLYEIIEAVKNGKETLNNAINVADKANAAYQAAWLNGHTAKNKAAKANAAAKAEEAAREELATLELELDEAFAEAIAEAEAEEEIVEAVFEAAKAMKPETMKIVRHKSEIDKEKKRLDMSVYEAAMVKASEKQKRRENAAKVKAANRIKAEGILQLKPSGIWAKRPAKDAKESAKWIRMLLDEQEAKKVITKKVDLVSESEEERRAAFKKWRENLCVVKPFTEADKGFENISRKIENAHASTFLDNPAMKSAGVFCDAFIAVSAMLGQPFYVLAEQGCKLLYEQLAVQNTAVSDLEDKIFEIKDIIKYTIETLIDEHPEWHGELMDIIRTEYRPQIKELKKQLNEVQAERRLVVKAIAIAKKDATSAELALINARGKVASKKAREAKKPEGRQYNVLDKAQINGYKLMAFEALNILPAKLKNQRKTLVEEAAKWKELAVKKENEASSVSDDTMKAARARVQKEFTNLYNMTKEMKENGECFEADSSRCQVNNARQSQLTDIIGVPYGTETDMIVSLEHSMANFLPLIVKEALSSDQEKAQKNIDELEYATLSVLTENGLNIKFASKNEKSRVAHYAFWNANNAALKVGKCVALSDAAYKIAKNAHQAGMTDEEFEEIKTNGSDMLKWWSYSTTPGCPIEYQGKPLTVNDILVVDSVELHRVFENVMTFNNNGESVTRKSDKTARTAWDGQLFFLVPIPSQQLRGGMAFKGYGVCCAYEDGRTMIDEIARREHLEIPEFIKDVDGKMRRWRNYKAICTADCWKWASWKREDGTKMSYEEYCSRLNKLAENNPYVNMMYTARIADATEESKRHLTRQSIQQFIFATKENFKELYKRGVNKVNRLRTVEGVYRKLMGLDKAEDERNAFEHLIEVCPELLDNELMKRYIEDVFNRSVAEAADSPEVDGIYPYIAEDPVAFFKIVIFGMDPDKIGLGYLKANQVNAAGVADNVKMYLVRYPNNYICGMIAVNWNDSIYDCVGNTMILSIDGYFLIRADGDVDGDEMCAIFDKIVVELMEKTIRLINPPLIVFPHQKLSKRVIHGKTERAAELAKAMVIANKFGPAVGQNSNLAAKFMHLASVARFELGKAMFEKNKDAEKKARWKMEKALSNAIIAHIAAIIAIDLAKTGEMPKWLQDRLAEISKYAGSKMPWNQRFRKDSKVMPWFCKDWDELTREEEPGNVDRGCRYVVEATDAYNYTAPTGDGFKYEDMLCAKDGLYIQGSKAKMQSDVLEKLDERNFTEAKDRAVLRKLHSEDPKDVVSVLDIFDFCWKNRAALAYRLQKNGGDRVDNAALVMDYMQTVHDLLIDFGSFNGNSTFMSMSEDKRRKSNVWKIMKSVFTVKDWDSKVKEGELTEEDRKAGFITRAEAEEHKSSDASRAIFAVKVFAFDLYQMVCEKKGIVNTWEMPKREEEDVIEDAPAPKSEWYDAADYMDDEYAKASA